MSEKSNQENIDNNSISNSPNPKLLKLSLPPRYQIGANKLNQNSIQYSPQKQSNSRYFNINSKVESSPRLEIGPEDESIHSVDKNDYSINYSDSISENLDTSSLKCSFNNVSKHNPNLFVSKCDFYPFNLNKKQMSAYEEDDGSTMAKFVKSKCIDKTESYKNDDYENNQVLKFCLTQYPLFKVNALTYLYYIILNYIILNYIKLYYINSLKLK